MDSRIAAAFDSAAIVRPSRSEPDLVHLTRALAGMAGADDILDGAPVQELRRLLGSVEHVVFVLLDGLGMNLIRRLPPASLLVRELKRVIRAVSPSTTACALTSIATAAWPAQHGVTGWFTHLPDHGLTISTLPMVERFSGEPLGTRGLTPSSLLPLRAYHDKLLFRSLTVLPSPIVNTAFARYSRADTPGAGYGTTAEAVSLIADFVGASPEPSYVHWYVPDVDSACHHDGVGASGVLELLARLDAELGELRRRLPSGARLVVTADHGLLDVTPADHLPLAHDDPLLGDLVVPPSGDARLPIFHVRPGRRERFARAFDERFAALGMVLLDSEEAAALGVFGDGPFLPASRARFGDYVGIAFRPVTLHYVVPVPPGSTPHRQYLALHGGLSPDEMEIPLIVA
jgi:hypothetical protein